MKRVFIGLLIICALVTLSSVAFAETKQAATTKAPAVKAVPQVAQAAGKAPVRPNFVIIGGAVTKIDSSNPDLQTIEVKSDTDNTVHTLNLTPYTNIVKATDISELKVGDNVRVMTRKAENKEVAINVLFGKLKKMTPPKKAETAQAAAVPAAQAAAKKK